MALPINSAPSYNLVVPSTGKQINYRPFLIKEEKALMIAQQSEDPKVMIDTLKQVIADCTERKIDVDELATFDLEYMFTQIRAKSVGENVELYLKCDTCEDEKAVTKVTLDLTQLQVEKDPKHTSKIVLFDDVGISLKYPTIEILKRLEGLSNSDIDQAFDIIVECIDSIYTSTELFNAKDQSKEELMAFLNNLTSEQFAKVQNFFETMPKLRKEIDYSCPVCGKAHHKVLEGLNSFF